MRWVLSILPVMVMFVCPSLSQGATCPQNVTSSFSVTSPGKVAFSREFKARLHFDGKLAKPWLPVAKFRVLKPGLNDWSAKLTGWNRNVPVNPDKVFGWWWWDLSPNRIDSDKPIGRFVISARLENRETFETCFVSKEIKRVRGRMGLPVPVKLTKWFGKPESNFSLEIKCFDIGLTHRLIDVNGAPLEFLFSFRGRSRRMVVTEPCTRSMENWPPFTLRTSRFRVSPHDWRFSSQLKIDWLGRSKKPFKLRVRVAQDGRHLLSARFRVKWQSRPSRSIWYESDAFVNYCINEIRPIYSKNGRLYCRTVDRSGYHVAFRSS